MNNNLAILNLHILGDQRLFKSFWLKVLCVQLVDYLCFVIFKLFFQKHKLLSLFRVLLHHLVLNLLLGSVCQSIHNLLCHLVFESYAIVWNIVRVNCGEVSRWQTKHFVSL